MLTIMLYVVKVLNDDIMPTLNKLREVSDVGFYHSKFLYTNVFLMCNIYTVFVLSYDRGMYCISFLLGTVTLP